MTFTEAIKTCLKEKYATFSGRATRSEYWYLVLFGYLLGFGITILGLACQMLEVTTIISAILALIFFIPGLAVCIRRLHDTGRSGWWYLLILVPYIGAFTLLIMFCMPSDGDNKYGVKPLN